MSKPTRQQNIFFFLFFIFVIFLSYITVKPFLILIIIALITAAILNPLYQKILPLVKNKSSIANAITMIIFILAFLIPLTLLLQMLLKQTQVFYGDVNDLISGNSIDIDKIINQINSTLEKVPYVETKLTKESVEAFIEQNAQSAINTFLSGILNVGKLILDTIPRLIIFLMILSSLIPAQTHIKKYIKQISPLDKKIDEMFIKKFFAMANSMIKGSFVIAFVQGILSGLVLKLVGVPYSFFWAILTIFLSIIPLGAGVINVPIGVALLIIGRYWQGLVVLAHHFAVITNIDNILRPRLVSKEAQLHPILTLLGALGGMNLFGFWGVIFGPIIMIFLVTTFDVYLEYFKDK